MIDKKHSKNQRVFGAQRNKISLVHPWKKWKASLIELKNEFGKKYKVTRKLLQYSISETRMFKSKKNALKQFKKWLR